jgi:hypothetical protein
VSGCPFLSWPTALSQLVWRILTHRLFKYSSSKDRIGFFDF